MYSDRASPRKHAAAVHHSPQAVVPASCHPVRRIAAAVTEDRRPFPLFEALPWLVVFGPRVEDDAPQAAPPQLVEHLQTDATGVYSTQSAGRYVA